MSAIRSGIFLLTAIPALAATLTVNVNTDTASGGLAGTGAGVGAGLAGDLRYTMRNAGPGDTIVFSLASPSTIPLNGPLPPITQNLTIDGGTYGRVVIDGNNLYRV